MNIVCRKLDSTVRRGAIVKALAILSPIPELCFSDGWATGLFPLLRRVLLDYFEENPSLSNDKPSLNAISSLYNALNDAGRECHISQIRSDAPFLSYSKKSMFQVIIISFFIYLILFKYENITKTNITILY